MRKLLAAAALAAPTAAAMPALAAPAQFGDPVQVSDDLSIDPIMDGRLRYEHVDQPTTDADALTLRLRAGMEAKLHGLSLLAEAEGTLGVVNDYNAFPFAVDSNQRRTRFSTVADPMNVELNRLQLQYKGKAATFMLGRQRINIDDQRWVGGVAWRQNEQTFDAARLEAKIGPVNLDGAYAVSQRTLFGVDAGPRQTYDGHFFFAGAGVKLGPVNAKGFAYLLDYDEAFFLANSSKTFGARATAALPLATKVKLDLMASYARQSDWQGNPFDYAADYLAGEAALSYGDFGLTGGYEKLGSDNGRAVQTPMATLFKFNGFADLFLTTPGTGLQDYYAGVSYKTSAVKPLPGLNANLTYHQFDSDTGGLSYGSEWDATVGFKLGRVGILARYANYDHRDFGADTEKFWLQAEFSY